MKHSYIPFLKNVNVNIKVIHTYIEQTKCLLSNLLFCLFCVEFALILIKELELQKMKNNLTYLSKRKKRAINAFDFECLSLRHSHAFNESLTALLQTIANSMDK